MSSSDLNCQNPKACDTLFLKQLSLDQRQLDTIIFGFNEKPNMCLVECQSHFYVQLFANFDFKYKTFENIFKTFGIYIFILNYDFLKIGTVLTFLKLITFWKLCFFN